MVTATVVFIHPNDMSRLLKTVDMFTIEPWYDNDNVKVINGVVYRETYNVPEVLPGILTPAETGGREIPPREIGISFTPKHS